MTFTVLGASGFIGSHLIKELRKREWNYFAPQKNYVFSKDVNLGHVFYCIGFTADFRQNPMETVKAHVCKLLEVIDNCSFESFLYLSSTRIYNGNKRGDELAVLNVNPSDFSDLYNISKLMGEAVCLAVKNERVRIARLSNVIGDDFKSDNFLLSLIRAAVDKQSIDLRVPRDSKKDYISINDVLDLLFLITLNGKDRIYNVSSGYNISNDELVNEIRSHTNCSVRFMEQVNGLSFPTISNERVTMEFGFKTRNILPEIGRLIKRYNKV